MFYRLTILFILLSADTCRLADAFVVTPTSNVAKTITTTIKQQRQQQQQQLQTRSQASIWTTLLCASSQEEDLELTRQIIRQHEERLAAASKAEAPTSSSIEDATDAVVSTPISSSQTATGTSIHDRPKNDLMIRAAFGEVVERTPVWLFRQAGRHLPEYENYKRTSNRNFLQLLQDPKSVAECTLQPIRRYNVDAAILFSDILVIAEALNVEVTMPGGVGIQVPNPLVSPSDVTSRLPSIDIAGKEQFIHDRLDHVIEAIKQIRIAMTKEDKSIPLIGFSAAPYTLLYYMVGGSSKKNTDIGVTWLKEYPEASQTLLDLLTSVIIEYMSAQVKAGVHMLQLFEAMGMMIDDSNFEKFAIPCLQQIATELKARHPTIPLMIFCRGACHMNDKLTNLGYHVVTIDGSVDRSIARALVGPTITLQGNYDPSELIMSNGKSIDTVRDTARTMLQELGPQRLIANLGEGLGGKESPELVDAFVNAIHEESAAMIVVDQQQLQQQR